MDILPFPLVYILLIGSGEVCDIFVSVEGDFFYVKLNKNTQVLAGWQ